MLLAGVGEADLIRDEADVPGREALGSGPEHQRRDERVVRHAEDVGGFSELGDVLGHVRARSNCECTVTPGFCFSKAVNSWAKGSARVPAPKTISVLLEFDPLVVVAGVLAPRAAGGHEHRKDDGADGDSDSDSAHAHLTPSVIAQ